MKSAKSDAESSSNVWKRSKKRQRIHEGDQKI